MQYITERIINISELEKIIQNCYLFCQLEEKSSPKSENIKKMKSLLREALDFEFCIERRKTIQND